MENTVKDDQNKTEKESIQTLEQKKRFASINDLIQKESKIIEIFQKSKKKLIETKPGLFLRPKNYEFKSLEYKSLFQYESIFPLKVKQEFSYIYDCLNFICYKPSEEKDSKNPEKYIEKIKNIFSSLKEKGTLLLLLDEFYVDNFFPNLILALGNDFKSKLFINFYFLDTNAFLFLVSIQKMADSEKPISIKDIKVLITDFFNNSKMLGSSPVNQMNSYLEQPLLKMRNYRLQCELNYSHIKILHPGEFYEMRLKSSPLNSEISYIVTIHDSPNPENQKKKQCYAVSLSYEITEEIVFSKQIPFSRMCEYLKAARIIVVESAILNPCKIQDLALELSNEIQLMKPEGFTDDIQMRLWEVQIPKQTVFQNEKFLVQDFDDKKKIRQIYFKNNLNILQGQIKTKLASKTKIANPPKGVTYYPIETQEKFKTKGVLQCIDDAIIPSFYEQSILCTVFYMNLTKYPKNTIKIMDIGAGMGSLSFYFYKLFKGNCEIDNIEKNKEIQEIGAKFFGFQNYDNENKVHWFFEEAQNCIEKMAKNNKDVSKNYYDLIFNEINEIKPKEDTVPYKEFFEDSFLENIKDLLMPFGIYTVYIKGKTYKAMYECYKHLEKHFPSIYNIASEGGLNSIFFCFKNAIEKTEYQEKFKTNKELIEKNNNIIDYSIIKNFMISVLSKVQDMDEEKKKMEKSANKF